MVGTSVRDSRNENTIANMTPLGQGHEQETRRRRSRKTWARTRYKCRAETRRRERTICEAPSIDRLLHALTLLEVIVDAFDGYGGLVDQDADRKLASSTRMPTASASPPKVMMLSVSPIAQSVPIAPKTDKGIDVATIRVERQLPRNNRIMRLVSAAAITPSRITPWMEARTNRD